MRHTERRGAAGREREREKEKKRKKEGGEKKKTVKMHFGLGSISKCILRRFQCAICPGTSQ